MIDQNVDEQIIDKSKKENMYMSSPRVSFN
jgi:hypothetical protein